MCPVYLTTIKEYIFEQYSLYLYKFKETTFYFKADKTDNNETKGLPNPCELRAHTLYGDFIKPFMNEKYN